MPTRTALPPNEWYHCYNRGVEKRKTFLDAEDYQRFTELLFVANSSESVRLADLTPEGRRKIFEQLKSRDQLVEIGAYCLMPNHFHIILRGTGDNAIGYFMQKVMTGYTMYFNMKHERTGALFGGSFNALHVGSDRYLQHLVSYVHLNPAEIFDARWKKGKADVTAVQRKLAVYPYSSLIDFTRSFDRPESKILSRVLYDMRPNTSTAQMIDEAHAYYQHSPNLKV